MKKIRYVLISTTLVICVLYFFKTYSEIDALWEYPKNDLAFFHQKKMPGFYSKVKFLVTGKFFTQKRKIEMLTSNVWKIDKILDSGGNNIESLGKSCYADFDGLVTFYQFENKNFLLFNKDYFVNFSFVEDNLIVTETSPKHHVGRLFKIKYILIGR